MNLLNINLLGTPPTKADIDGALIRARARKVYADNKRRKTAIFYAIFSLAGSVSGFALFGFWEAVIWSVVVFGVATYMFYELFGDAADTSQEETDLFPISDYFCGFVLKAAKLDSRVDAYRQRVAQQGRDLTQLEGIAFKYWVEHGFEASKRIEAVRSTAPLNVHLPSATA